MQPQFFIFVAILATFATSEDPVPRFLLYTKSNPNAPQELKPDDLWTISGSNFAVNKPVKFLTHGYGVNYLSEFPQDMKNTFVSLPETYNVIVVDWQNLNQPTYDIAVENALLVGEEIAKLVTALLENRFSRHCDIHYIGHSLGAQVGAFISSHLSEKLHRITGLDPATPGFENDLVPTSERLDPTDAYFVDVIRTSCGLPCNATVPIPPQGTVVFYVNGGINQPGCKGVDPPGLEGLCNHSRAYILYQESITTKVGFKGHKCQSYLNLVSGCDQKHFALMGEFANQGLTGIYAVQTNNVPPYAKS